MSDKKKQPKTVPACPYCEVTVHKTGNGYTCPKCGREFEKSEVDHVDPDYMKELR